MKTRRDTHGTLRRIERGAPTEPGLRHRSHRGIFFLVVLAFAVGLCLSPASAQTTPSGDGLPQVNTDGWTSSAVCGECHQSIHAVWRHSLHANAWTNGVFQAAYRRAIDTYGAEDARECLTCHAPTVRHGGDYEVKQKVTAEGITCDFCHSVNAVDLDDPKERFRLTVGAAKYGPLRHAQSPAHKVVNSDLHKSSEFCAACHEYRTPEGLLVLGTYSEWKASVYAKRGTQCQDCHMPLVPGRVVGLGIKKDTPNEVNWHDVSGSHDIDRVRAAVKLELVGYEWLGERVWVYVKVTNEGSGHCFPTGLPMHRAVLEVTLREGTRVIDQREIPFEVVMLDKAGRPLRREHEVLVQAARVRSDTRIKPKEARTVDISFRDIKATKLAVTATLNYEYTTETLVPGEKEGEERVEPVTMKFLIATSQSTMRQLGR